MALRAPLIPIDESRPLTLPGKKSPSVNLSRRKFLVQYCPAASVAFLPASLGFARFRPPLLGQDRSCASELEIHPRYRSLGVIDAIFKKVPPGFDGFRAERYAALIARIFGAWSAELLSSPQTTGALENAMSPDFSGASPEPVSSETARSGSIIEVSRLNFASKPSLGQQTFLRGLRRSLSSFSRILTAEFQVTSIRELTAPASSEATTSLDTSVHYELVGTGPSFHREQRVGDWQLAWDVLRSGEVRLGNWRTVGETRSRSLQAIFSDLTARAFPGVASASSQLGHGSDYWRTIIDGVCGIDIYGHNGVSLADVDGDGFDDLYVCQPAGLPNRLFRNRGDGTFEDITEHSGLGVLENTACALFVDIDNDGHQDAIIVRSEGPLLFLGDGTGRFRPRPKAFHFQADPSGSFTGAAAADYDRDGWLDIYFCLYSYYQGSNEYRYPTPYFDAENGPPNFLMRNQRDGTFRDVTRESGLDRNNTRFSFCCAWADFDDDHWPDLYVVNDFGRKNLYRNNGDGTFTDVARESGVEDVGAGMSVCWLDYDNDGRRDLYVADMWSAAGLRVSEQENFQPQASEEIRALYRKHAMGNSLFANRGHGRFDDSSERSRTRIGRWAWSSDAFDFDQDGLSDLYVANGMISGPVREDLNSFFWRQVVANSPISPGPSDRYEQGWNTINELIRADGTWSGYERNIVYRNNGDGTFSDVSGVTGLDYREDSRTFALGDFDHDGRVEIFLKNRNAPQLRLLENIAPELGPAIAFRLTGQESNRDAIGAAVTVESESGRRTLVLQAGSGFLAQHSKELFFGLADAKVPVRASIRWPSGFDQSLTDLPLNHRIWVEEGSPPTRIEPFRKWSPEPADAKNAAAPAESESLPIAAETWLLAPVPAPDFSLPDVTGKLHSLAAHLGKPVLLYFCSTRPANSPSELAALDRSYRRLIGEGFQLLAIIVDQPCAPGVPSISYERFSFPTLRVSADVMAVYNILYRSLFDRHRDLALPCAFLVDEAGAIVKVYAGGVPTRAIDDDFRHIPRTDAERLAKGLPFAGVIESADFDRNYLSLGSALFERGYTDQSEMFFELARRDDPSSAEPYYGLGSVYLEQQKNARARENFERAAKLPANYPGTLPRVWNNLGIVAAREGSTEEAIGNFRRALEIDPDFLIALVNIGNAYRRQKRWDEAKRALEHSIELSPEDADAYYGLGMVFAELNDTDRAYDLLQKALRTRPDYPEALNNLGVLYVRTHRPDDAEKSFRESIRVAPGYDQAYLNLARLYEVEHETRKARAILVELLKQHPGHAQAQRELDGLPQ
jgi:tetratricopeptide (TPR) repeat protein/peroxiredoxin